MSMRMSLRICSPAHPSQCVHIVINSATGAAAIDTSDATFALTNDQTSGTYNAGVSRARAYANPYACTGTTSVATLLAGTVAMTGYANVNLSGTAFAIAGIPCGGAANCTCSSAGNPVCGSFSASTYAGAGAIVYSLSGQAAVLLADGSCGSWSATTGFIPLDGIVAPMNPACGGVPCGLGGSSCMTLPVSRNGTTLNQTFWVSSAGVVYLPLPAQTTRPFPTIAAVNAGAAAPNTVSYSNIWCVCTC